MNGILCAYFLLNIAKPPTVLATALQPPSMASLIIFSGSKYNGLGTNDAPALCSTPWSTGSMDK